MEKLKMHSKDLTQDNLAKIQAAFPNCVTERQNAQGKIELAIDFDLLRQELSGNIVEGPQERYRLDWPGKREAMLTANAPIAKTLRPARDESVNFDDTENLFIEGDNLDALKLLQETYLGKVKMIYIDPPYNTGKDFVYEDDFAETTEEFLQRSNQKDEQGNRFVSNTESSGRFHSDWLSMMLPRLKLARNLLTEDGVIFISIDDGEQANLKRVCDEVFGAENFITNIIWQGGRKNDSRRFSVVHDYILVYVKNDSYLTEEQVKWRERKEGLDEVYNKVSELKNKYANDYSAASRELKRWFESLGEDNPSKEHAHYTRVDEQGVFYGDNISSPNYRENLIFEYKGYKPPQNGWRYNREAMKRLESEGLLIFPESKDSRIQYKRYLHHTETWIPSSLIYKDRRAASKSLSNLLGGNYFDFPKDVNVLARLIETFTNSNDLVLDFFAGSSSTAHACIKLNAKRNLENKFIMVQLPETVDEKHSAYKAGYKTIAEISKERIRRAGTQIIEGECHEDWNKDIGFRVLKVDTSNMQDVYYQPQQLSQDDLFTSVDNIKPDRSSEDLLFQVLLDWGVDLTLPIRRETIQDKDVFIVDDNALVACFEQGISEALIHELAALNPLRAVFRDNGFASDDVKINATQIFKQNSPITDVKAI